MFGWGGGVIFPIKAYLHLHYVMQYLHTHTFSLGLSLLTSWANMLSPRGNVPLIFFKRYNYDGVNLRHHRSRLKPRFWDIYSLVLKDVVS